MVALRTELGGGVAVTGANVSMSTQNRPVPTQTTQVTPGAIWYPPRSASQPGPRRLGRRSYSGGPVAGPAAGNWQVTGDGRGARPAWPGHGTGDAGSFEYGPGGYGTRPISNRRSFPSRARTPGYQHGRLIARDRHVLEARGYTTTSGAHPDPYPGIPNPDGDGPARPSYRMLDRTLSWQLGTDATAYLDNDGYHAATTAGASRRYPLGTQGDPWTRKYGGTPGLYHPYGARGYVEGPAPAVRALPGDGSGARAGTLLAQGAAGDGPQKLYGGTPHGLHTPTVPAPVLSQARSRGTAQIQPPATMRPLNNKIAGQSYSQSVVHLDGSGGVKVPRTAPGRQPGVNARFRGTRGTS